MSHVTNRVGVEAPRELLEEVRFVVLAHLDGSEVVQAFPIAFRWNEVASWSACQAGRSRAGRA